MSAKGDVPFGTLLSYKGLALRRVLLSEER